MRWTAWRRRLTGAGIPFAGHRHGFLIVITVVSALTLLGGVVVMRRRRDW